MSAPNQRVGVNPLHLRGPHPLNPRRIAIKALLVVSSELPELIGLCRRILVMREGRLAGEVARADFSEATLMQLMAGVAAA